MTEPHLSTPFGRRPLSRAQILAQRSVHRARAENRAAAADETGETPQPTPVHKWRAFEHALAARPRLGLSDRALTVLHALLSFHPEVMLVPGEATIVHASNAKLAARAHGMSIPTLQRRLAELLEAGLISRRDSPNGKRYVRRDGEGAVTEAFGLDLAPFALQAEALAAHAAEVAAEARAVRVARERATLARRDILKLAEALDRAGDAAGAQEVIARLAATDRRLPRQPSLTMAETLALRLEALAAEAQRLVLARMPSSEQAIADDGMAPERKDLAAANGRSGEPAGHIKQGSSPPADVTDGTLDYSSHTTCNVSQFETHNQNQIPEKYEFEPISQGAQGQRRTHATEQAMLPGSRTGPAVRKKSEAGASSQPITLGLVLQACPQLHDYARGGRIKTWSDALDAAHIMRAALGISPDAWSQAQDAMGLADAAVAVAAILETGERIRSPGGYLRRLTEQARLSRFSTGPMLMALMAQTMKAKAAKTNATG